MAAPGLDRLFTKGFYGTAVNRFLSVTTKGWYDEITTIVHILTVADQMFFADSIELVIPSWLRKVHIGDDVYRIVIKRIR